MKIHLSGILRRGVKALLWITEKLPKALLFNEANHERFELTQCLPDGDYIAHTALGIVTLGSLLESVCYAHSR